MSAPVSKYQDVSRFGLDGLPGMDQSGAIITGPKVIGERVAARFLRMPGAAWWDRSPESAVGLGRYLNADLEPGELDQLRGKLLRAAQAEDGVVRAIVELTLTEDGITVEATLTTVEGEVELNVAASGAVAILSPEAAP